MSLVMGVLSGLGALAILGVVVLVIFALKRWPQVVLVLVGAQAVVQWELPNSLLLTSIAGTNIFLLDATSVVLFAVGVLNFATQHKRLGAYGLWWLATGTTLAISLVVGVATFGLASAINEGRLILPVFGISLWALSIDWTAPRNRQLLDRFAAIVGWSLIAVALYHGATFGFGGADDFVQADGIAQTSRILVAGQSLLLILCMITVLSRWTVTRSKVDLIGGLAFGLIVIISQQRTAWIALLAVATAALVLSKSRERTTLIIGAIVSALFILCLVRSGLLQSVLQDLTDSATSTGTYDGRLESWQALLTGSFAKGFGTVIFGSPWGAGFVRQEFDGRIVAYAPHNWYLTIYLRAGIIGLALYVSLILEILIRVIRRRSVAIATLLIATHVFAWSYTMPWYSYLFIALATQVALAPAIRNRTSLQKRGAFIYAPIGRFRGIDRHLEKTTRPSVQ